MIYVWYIVAAIVLVIPQILQGGVLTLFLADGNGNQYSVEKNIGTEESGTVREYDIREGRADHSYVGFSFHPGEDQMYVSTEPYFSHMSGSRKLWKFEITHLFPPQDQIDSKYEQQFLFEMGDCVPLLGDDYVVVATGLTEEDARQTNLPQYSGGDEVVVGVYNDVRPGDILSGSFHYEAPPSFQGLDLEVRKQRRDPNESSLVMGDTGYQNVAELDTTQSADCATQIDDTMVEYTDSGHLDENGDPIFTSDGGTPNPDGSNVYPATGFTAARNNQNVIPANPTEFIPPEDFEALGDQFDAVQLDDVIAEGEEALDEATDEEQEEEAQTVNILRWFQTLFATAQNRIGNFLSRVTGISGDGFLGEVVRVGGERPAFQGILENYEFTIMGQTFEMKVRDWSLTFYDLLSIVFNFTSYFLFVLLCFEGVKAFQGIVQTLGATNQISVGTGNALGLLNRTGIAEIAVAGTIFTFIVTVMVSALEGGIGVLVGQVYAFEFGSYLDGEIFAFVDGIFNISGWIAYLVASFALKHTAMIATVTVTLTSKFLPRLS
ncbi:MAG: hypothetical protein AAGH40_14030 [Verrucomicrobiota bacterium]